MHLIPPEKAARRLAASLFAASIAMVPLAVGRSAPSPQPSATVHAPAPPATKPAPVPSQAASPGPAVEPQSSPGASPSSEESASPEESPSPAASPQEATDPADEPSPAASAEPSAKTTDAFEALEKRLSPYQLSPAFTGVLRNPFVLSAKMMKNAPKVAGTPDERAQKLKITGVFFGVRVKAIRVAGVRLERGDWFYEESGKIKKAPDKEKGEFQVEQILPDKILLFHKGGETFERSTKLRSQAALAPSPSPSPEGTGEPEASSSPSQ